MQVGKHIVISTMIIASFAIQRVSFALDKERDTAIRQLITNFIHDNAQLNAQDKIDINIAESALPTDLPNCPTPIHVAWPDAMNAETATSVLLSCQGAVSWQSYIPVSIQVSTPVMYAKHSIPLHETINGDDIDLKWVDKKLLYNGYFQSSQEIIGSIATHTIMAGAVLNPHMIQSPRIIARNQVITITAESNGVRVSMKGITRSEGGLHDTIKVYNPASKRIIDAMVVGPNDAKVIA